MNAGGPCIVEDAMPRTITAIVAAAGIAAATLATPKPAEARCIGCWVGAGVAAAVIGGAIASSAYGYGPYGYGYGGYGYGGYGYGGYGFSPALGYALSPAARYGDAPSYRFRYGHAPPLLRPPHAPRPRHRRLVRSYARGAPRFLAL